jgi:hypothetical protein
VLWRQTQPLANKRERMRGRNPVVPIFCIDPEETAAFMSKKKQPWIAFKVLAAGAIDPKSGFTYAFENGADFVAVGMFDFNITEDVKVIKEVLSGLKRPRAWIA